MSSISSKAPDEFLDLNTIVFPRFNSEHVEFFQEMIKLHQQERLRLDPRSLSKVLFDLQWNSLESMELTYKWLIDANFAVIQSEVEERTGKSYDPQETISLAGNQLMSDAVQDGNNTF